MMVKSILIIPTLVISPLVIAALIKMTFISRSIAIVVYQFAVVV